MSYISHYNEYGDLDETNIAVGTGTIDNGTVGGVLSINALDNTKFDISAGRGLHVDLANNDTEIIEWNDCISCTPTYLNTHLISWIAMDKNAQIIQKSSPFTSEERRDYIVLGILVHVNKTFIDNINMTHYPADHIVNQFVDMSEALGFMQISGNLFSAYTTNLQMKKSEGTIWKTGSNYHLDIHNPHLLGLASLNPLLMQYRFQDGTNYTGLSQATVIPTLYESSPGVASSVTASDPWTVQRIYCFTSNNVKLMFGQSVYKTLADAVAGLSSDPFVVEPSIQANGLFRCYLVINKDCTNLADSATCKFIHAGKFGDIGGASGAGTTTMQEAYNNSGTQNPQILLTSNNGPLKIKNYSASNPNIIECYDENGGLNCSITRTGINMHSLGSLSNCVYIDNKLTADLLTSNTDITVTLLDFPNFTTTSTTTASHITLYGTNYGFGVASSTLRYYSADIHDFRSGGTSMLILDKTGSKITLGAKTNNNEDGSVGSPAYSFVSSTNSGMWRDTTNRLCFSAGGNRRLVLDDADNIYFLFGTGSGSTYYYMTTLALLPWTDDAQNLGNAAKRYNDIYASNGTIQTSDIRLKKDIKDINLGLSFINKLRPVSYKWKDVINIDEEGVETVKTYTRPHYGLIAQELEASMNEEGITISDNDILCNDYIRDGEGTDRYGIRYGSLIAVLIKSIQELSNRVVELENIISNQ